MFELLAFVLTFVAVLAIGGSILLVRAGKKRQVMERLKGPLPDQGEQPRPSGTSWIAEAMSAVGSLASIGKPSPVLRSKLAKAGYHGANAPAVYLGAKVLLLAIGPVVLPFLLVFLNLPLGITIVLVLGGAMVLFLVPNMLVARRRNARSTNIRRHLADAIDLLEVSVSAGMGLDVAWNMVADEVRRVSHVLADEMALTNLEIHLGSPRGIAMRNLVDRTDVKEIAMLVAVMAQSERFGTSIADALSTFASTMREGRSSRAEETAERLAVRMLFPMVLFIFPAIFVIAVGPAGMTIAEMMLSGN